VAGLYGKPGLPLTHGEPGDPRPPVPAHAVGVAVALKAGLFRCNFLALRDYYIRKWGALPRDNLKQTGGEVFTSPWNSGRELGYWDPSTVEELKVRYARD